MAFQTLIKYSSEVHQTKHHHYCNVPQQAFFLKCDETLHIASGGLNMQTGFADHIVWSLGSLASHCIGWVKSPFIELYVVMPLYLCLLLVSCWCWSVPHIYSMSAHPNKASRDVFCSFSALFRGTLCATVPFRGQQLSHCWRAVLGLVFTFGANFSIGVWITKFAYVADV